MALDKKPAAIFLNRWSRIPTENDIGVIAIYITESELGLQGAVLFF